MCLLCGEFVSGAQWTDRHVKDRARARGTDDGGYTRDRAHRAALANEVLKHYGLGVKDWGGSEYVLTDGKGASRLVADLGSLWPEAVKLAGRPFNPLDPGLGERLRAASLD